MKNLKSVILFSILLLIPVGIQNSYAGGSEPVIGETRWFAGNFAPRGTALCDGQLLAVSQNDALFATLGTTFGGDGRTTFGLPEMRGRMPVDDGSGPGLARLNLGQEGGTETERLNTNQLPTHTHTLMASSELGESTDPQGNVLHTGQHPFLHRMYRGSGTPVNMHQDSIASTGGESHTNLPPFLAINCLINLVGLFTFPDGPGGQTFLGEIRWVGFNFEPRGWARCDGQTLPIDQNTALFSILGTTYGGDGDETFRLPDLRGRMPMHTTTSNLGDKAGLQSVSLTVDEIASHNHQLRATMSNGDSGVPTNNLLATGTHPYAQRIYQSNTLDINMGSQAITNTGGGAAHNNMPPFLTLHCIIALTGTVPPRIGTDPPVGEPFLGEIKWFGGNFTPVGYKKCNGELLPIAQNTALFATLGTIYGGDGRTTLGLPNLDERIPMHPGNGPGLSSVRLGQTGGTPTVTLTESQLAAHTHTLQAFSELGNSIDPTGNLRAGGLHTNYHDIYSSVGTRTDMHGSALYDTGGDQPHQNLPPHLKITCLIAITGTFPSRN